MGIKLKKRSRKYKEERTQSLSESGDEDPSQVFTEKILQKKVQLEFKQFVQKKNLSKVYSYIKRMMGAYTTFNYRPQYGFNENWESKVDEPSEDRMFGVLKQSSFLYFVLSFLLMCLKAAIIWYTSIRRIFDCQAFHELYLILPGVLLAASALIIERLIRKGSVQAIKSTDIIALVKNLFLIAYCFLAYFHQLDSESVTILLDLGFIMLEHQSSSKLYTFFRRILISSRYKNQLNIMDLLLTMLIVGHIFSLLLYSAALVNPNPGENWLSKIPVELRSWEDRYLYSLYFSFTTMLTIGYGDISPVSRIQILAILTVQIIGVAFFGYVVSEIGSHLSSMRKSQEELDHNIGMIDRLSKYYDLDKDVSLKVRDYLVANQASEEEFRSEDEDKFLSQISEDLREDITNETNTKLIRKSLFFICGWSKNFRNELAKKLMKKVFPPNQYLLESEKQQIFIIQKGEVEIFAEKKWRGRTLLKRHAKNIVSDSKDEILSNVYGYSRTLTKRPIPLLAVAKNCVVSYTLGLESFLDVLSREPTDYEHHFELKHKMELLKLPQLMEAPHLIDPKQHFSRNAYYFILKKQKEVTLGLRKKWKRRHRRGACVHQDIDTNSRNSQTETINRFNPNRTETGFVSQQAIQTPESVEGLDVEREYKNYFIKNNLVNVIRKMESTLF